MYSIRPPTVLSRALVARDVQAFGIKYSSNSDLLGALAAGMEAGILTGSDADLVRQAREGDQDRLPSGLLDVALNSGIPIAAQIVADRLFAVKVERYFTVLRHLVVPGPETVQEAVEAMDELHLGLLAHRIATYGSVSKEEAKN